MATNDKSTKPEKDGQHKKTQPLSQEAITFTDTLLAKVLLLDYLVQIPEFIQLWRQAREIPEAIMNTTRPRIMDIFANLSPGAREALVIGEKAYSLYDQDTLNEAELAAAKLKLLGDTVNDDLRKAGTPVDYRSRLEALVEPLGVPALVDFMMVKDMKDWGVDRVLAGPVTEPARDLLESAFIRGLTDLSPMEAVSETQASIRRRVKRKISPLSRHMKRYALEQRIRLWVRNVVCGETIVKISDKIQDMQRVDTDVYTEPVEWIKKQIREASRILKVERPPGRPRKGGVLSHWKMMLK